MSRTIDFDHAMLLIDEAYNKGFEDRIYEPRPSKRDEIKARFMKSIEPELKPYMEKRK